jgi:hypothetical protein
LDFNLYVDEDSYDELSMKLHEAYLSEQNAGGTD